MFAVTSILLVCFLPFAEAVSTDLDDFDMYGSMLVANDKIVVFTIDRRRAVFGVARPWNSSDFCVYDFRYLSYGGNYVIDLAVPRFGSSGPNTFFYSTQFMNGSHLSGSVFLRVTVNSSSPCGFSNHSLAFWGLYPPPDSVLAVSTTGDFLLYMEGSITSMFQTSSSVWNHRNGNPWPWPDNGTFVPYAVDISVGGWGVLAGEAVVGSVFIPTLYLISYPSYFNSSPHNYVVLDLWRVSFDYSWQQQKARPASASLDEYLIYASSVSINNQGDVLFGVQFMNTVFHFYVNLTNPQQLVLKSSRINSVNVPGIGFGKSVAWLNDTTAVILANNVSMDYTTWHASRIEIYDLSDGKQLNDTQGPLSFFPNRQQPMPATIPGPIVLIAASFANSVTFMNDKGLVYMVYPSPSGHSGVTSVANRRGTNMYFASTMMCPSGSDRVGGSDIKYIFSPCKLCQSGSYSDGSAQTSVGCSGCNTNTDFCSLGAVAQVPVSYLENRRQIVYAAESTGQQKFDDILLSNMFDLNLQTKCLVTTPMFWALTLIGLTLIFYLAMLILQWTGKCLKMQATVQTVLKHFDLINDGQRWIGGLLSFSVMVMIVFAALFTTSFLKQYPQATSTAPEFTCNKELRNSKVLSSMKPFGTQTSSRSSNIFTLMAEQKLDMTLTLLNTIANRQVRIEQIVAANVRVLPAQVTVPMAGLIEISCTLDVNIGKVVFNISGSETIGGLRIALNASAVSGSFIQVKEIDFSNSFSHGKRVLSSASYFKIELVPLVNETKALETDGTAQFSGVWLPLMSKEDDRNFMNEEEYESYDRTPVKTVTIELKQAAYYISRIEKPITRSIRALFRNVIFASTCMELFGFAFLVMKLIFIPLFQLIRRKIRPKPEDEAEKNEENSDAESKGAEESDDDDAEVPEQSRLDPAVNQWYMPDVQV